MSKHDTILLSELRINSRKSLSSIANERHIPITTLFSAYKQLISHLNFRHTSIIDFSFMGFESRRIIHLSAQDRTGLKEYLVRHPSANNVYSLQEYDFGADMIFSDLEQYYCFLEDINRFNISEFTSFPVVKHIKVEGFMPKKLIRA
ncbi:MAG: hypothetical protein KKG59_03855 [Nanoarchaeota archaeon]|nr:hypothetical protein [Nanoarchaeota archaeon]